MNFTDNSIASGIARGTQGYVGWGDAFVDFANNGWLDFFLVDGHVYPQVDTHAHGDPLSASRSCYFSIGMTERSRTSAGVWDRRLRFRK